MNIYVHELKSHLKALIIWCLAIIILLAMGLQEFQGMKDAGTNITELINRMPRALQILIGGGAFDLTTKIGYYSVLNLYLSLMIAIHAIMLGSGIIAKEERDKTIEFLVVKPVERKTIISCKLLSAFTQVVILNLSTLLFSLLLYKHSDILKLMLGTFLIQLLFLSIGAIIAAIKKNSKGAQGVGTGIILFAYIFSIFVDLIDIAILKYLTPFKYFDARTLLIEGGFNLILIIITLLISIISIYFTHYYYTKRDLNI